jgi:hypothetical protein
MIGMEFKLILGFIIALAIIAIIFAMIFIPASAFGQNSGKQMSFREFCVFWSLNGYKEGAGETVERNGINRGSPTEYCPSAIGKSVLTSLDSSDIEKCRNVCRGVA